MTDLFNTDYDKFTSMLRRAGYTQVEDLKYIYNTDGIQKEFDVKLDLDEPKLNLKHGIKVTIEEGIGYGGFFTQFFFNEHGSFIGHGVWE